MISQINKPYFLLFPGILSPQLQTESAMQPQSSQGEELEYDQQILNDMRELYYQVLSFEFIGASESDPHATAHRQRIKGILEPQLMSVLQGWSQGLPTPGVIVNAWWRDVITVLYRPTGITPEGKALSAKLKDEMFKYFDDDKIEGWDAGSEAMVVEIHGEMREADALNSGPATSGSLALTTGAPSTTVPHLGPPRLRAISTRNLRWTVSVLTQCVSCAIKS